MILELQEAILEAVIELSNIPFAPQDAAQQHALMRQIASFGNRAEGIRWMAQIAAARWTRWLGPAELRGIYCTRFRPADGIEADVTATSGFTPDDNESAYLERQAAETQRKFAQWKREAARLPAPERQANRGLLEAVSWHAEVRRLE